MLWVIPNVIAVGLDRPFFLALQFMENCSGSNPLFSLCICFLFSHDFQERCRRTKLSYFHFISLQPRVLWERNPWVGSAVAELQWSKSWGRGRGEWLWDRMNEQQNDIVRFFNSSTQLIADFPFEFYWLSLRFVTFQVITKRSAPRSSVPTSFHNLTY